MCVGIYLCMVVMRQANPDRLDHRSLSFLFTACAAGRATSTEAVLQYGRGHVVIVPDQARTTGNNVGGHPLADSSSGGGGRGGARARG